MYSGHYNICSSKSFLQSPSVGVDYVVVLSWIVHLSAVAEESDFGSHSCLHQCSF
jgi:hypothetical protein